MIQMKKRAQFPNAYTYSLLLRGFATLAENDPSVKLQALSLYRSLLAPNSKVEPVPQITTPLLSVLAVAGDLDSIWDVLSKLPEKGQNSPDAGVYTTVLVALRANAVSDEAWRLERKGKAIEKPKDAAEVAEIKKAAVQQGRQIWSDVMGRWDRGELAMDEQLMTAMGELLLVSADQSDIAEVFTVLEEVAQIPQQRSLRQTSRARIATSTHQPDEQLELVSQKHQRKQTSVKFANHTLTLLLKACYALKQWNVGMSYWDLLVKGTDESSAGRNLIRPDFETYLHYLRILRAARSSSRAVAALHKMDESGLLVSRNASKVFKIALPTCWRNGQSVHAMRDAAAMYRIMMNKLGPKVQECKTMLLIVQLMQSHREDVESVVETLRLLVLGPEPVKETVDRKRNLVAALAESTEDSAARQDVVMLARNIIGATDVVLKDLAAVRHRSFLDSMRLAMTYLVQRYQENVEEDVDEAAPEEQVGTSTRRRKVPRKRKLEDLEAEWQEGFGSAFPGEVDWTPMNP
jgi:hypothetical protein